MFGWAGSVIIARTLSPDDWGRYSFVFALLGIMSVITDLGVGRVVLARLNSEDPDEIAGISGSFIALRTTLGFLGYGIAVGYAWLTGLAPLVVLAAALAGVDGGARHPGERPVRAVPESTATDVRGGVGHHRPDHPVPGNPRGRDVAPLAAVVHPARHPPGGRGHHRPGRGGAGPVRAGHAALATPPHALLGEMLREAIPISIGFALLTLLERIDMLMLERLGTYEAVGLYAVGYKFSDLLALVVSALAIPYTTVLIKAWPNRTEEFRERVYQPIAVAALLGGLAVVVFWPAARGVVTLLYGDQFAPAATAAALLVTASALSGLLYVVVSALIAARKLRVFPWIAAAGLLLNIGLNALLIPEWSILGAATATLTTQVIMLVSMLLLLQFTLGIPGVAPWGLLLRQCAVAAIVAVSATSLHAAGEWSWLVVSLLAGAAHLVISMGVDKQVRALVLAPLRRGSD
ncbi:polysaccharide biosynthesis C-terminal domain-containing protein [Corynebacterium suedekumii]|nr:polysaccharide biosynthesis C-terminal domain-containing protein [Corynebacterium suedekumii]